MDDKNNAQHKEEGSYMYYRDYSRDADVGGTVKHNHRTGVALASKSAARLRGRAGRSRGKNGARENNKARGGIKAR